MNLYNNILKISIASLSLLLISACATKTKTIVQTKLVPLNIEIQSKPKPVDLQGVTWYVVTEKNLEKFIQSFKDVNGEFVVVAINIKDYEKLSLNTAELTRYIKQQNELIVYYENSIRNSN